MIAEGQRFKAVADLVVLVVDGDPLHAPGVEIMIVALDQLRAGAAFAGLDVDRVDLIVGRRDQLGGGRIDEADDRRQVFRPDLAVGRGHQSAQALAVLADDKRRIAEGPRPGMGTVLPLRVDDEIVIIDPFGGPERILAAHRIRFGLIMDVVDDEGIVFGPGDMGPVRRDPGRTHGRLAREILDLERGRLGRGRHRIRSLCHSRQGERQNGDSQRHKTPDHHRPPTATVSRATGS